MTIVCPTDLSYSAAPAEEQAHRLAVALGADILFLHIASEPPLFNEGPLSRGDPKAVYEAQRRWATEELHACVARATSAGVQARFALTVGVPAAAIVRTAEQEKAEMIVMGTHGRSGLNRLLLGSVAERVIRTAPCPVMTVRPSK